MKFKKNQLLLLILLVFCACNDENNMPASEVNLNSNPEFSLSSAQESGFSFETMTIVKDTAQILNADFIVLPQLNAYGALVSPFFGQYNLKSGFALIKQFDNLADAQSFFDSYTVFTGNDSDFNIYGLSVKPFQIWIVKTGLNTYGKILVLTGKAEFSNKSYYANVSFKAALLK